jgi:mannan endo-1,4-beta-mannosidase
MKRLQLLHLCVFVTASVISSVAAPAPKDWPCITRRGDQLFEGERPFRFLGLAASNLTQNEGQVRPDFSNRFPDEYEIRDVLGSIHQLGGRATRCFGLSIFAAADGGIPVFISGRRTYNEEAFRCLDRVLALCHEYDVRVIVPLIIAQQFTGVRGVDEFAALSGKPGAAFWTDPEVRDDFKHLLQFLINRRNTISGLRYGDDPAILAWQLGNEFPSWWGDRHLDEATWKPRVTAWSCEMAAYLKELDPHHLVMEGGGDRATFLADPNIDVISTHLYEYWNRLSGLPTDLAALARTEAAECHGRKALAIDEFGLGGTENLRHLMRAIRTEGVAGGLLWGIRGHRRDGGFYYHNEGGTAVNSYHWPGFTAGFAYDERQVLDLLRTEAFALRGESAPPLAPPSPAPILLRAGAGLTWRGSTGAGTYTLERAERPEGPWQILAVGLEDSVIADVRAYEEKHAATPDVLYTDETAPAGRRSYYRIRGINAAGESPESAVLEFSRSE